VIHTHAHLYVFDTHAVAQAGLGAAPDVVDLVDGEAAPAACQTGPMR
jgi:hypothetical protein